MRYAILLGLALLIVPAWADTPPASEPCQAFATVECAGSYDLAYARMACAINTRITALSVGAAARSDQNDLRAFANKLMTEQVRLTIPVRTYIAQVCGDESARAGCGPCPVSDPLADLRGSQLNSAYVMETLALMRQSLATSNDAFVRATDPGLRSAAMANAKAASDAIGKLRNWLDMGFLTEQQLERFCGMHPSSTRCPQ